MNKIKLYIALLLFCCAGASELKVTTLETKSVNYENGEIGAPTFRILCINGYRWLQSGSGNTKTLSQMFENNIVYYGGVKMYNVSAIKCENK